MTSPRTSTAARLGRISNLVHGFIYFSTEASERYAALGLTGRQHYFAGRSAAMGPVGPDVVASTFYNFNPEVVYAAIPSAWDVASPAHVQAARFQAAADVLDRTCADIDQAHLERAIEITTVMVDGVDHGDKPIAAGNHNVELPAEPLLRLWQLVTIVREWRGDAHVEALRNAEISGIEALVLHAATDQVPAAVLQATRAWSNDEWAQALSGLADRRLLEADGTFTGVGRELRESIEAATNTEAQALVDAVGDPAASELCDLLRPLRSGLLESGVFGQPLGGTGS